MEFEKQGLRVVALCAEGLTSGDETNSVDADLTAAKSVAGRHGEDLRMGLASRDLVRQLTELSHQAVYQERPLPLPVSFLVDRRGQIALIYKGPVEPKQLARDIELLEATPREIERAALPFPGRGSRHLFPEGEIAKAIALREAGYPDDCQYELRIFLTSKLPQIRAGGGALDEDAQREVGQAYFLLATVEQEQGRMTTAVKAYRNALQFLDDDPNARLALFKVLWRAKQHPQAQTELVEVMRRWPRNVEVAIAIGQTWMELGQLAAAARHLDRAVRLAPTGGLARFNMAVALQQQGKVAEALEHYDRLLTDSTVALNARNNVAWIRATHTDAKFREAAVAVKLAELNARATGYREPATLDTLAAAYAEAGRFDRAVATAKAAIVLARASHQEQLSEGLKARLQLYLAKKPYREPAAGEP